MLHNKHLILSDVKIYQRLVDSFLKSNDLGGSSHPCVIANYLLSTAKHSHTQRKIDVFFFCMFESV